MSNKKKRPARKKHLQKKQIWTIAAIAAAVVLAVIIGICAYAHHYNQQEHADFLSQDELYQYNYLLTAFGRNASLTADDQVLVLESVSKNLGGDTVATFVIYTYSSAADMEAALNMTAEEIAENANYEYMGQGTVTLVDDSFAGMSNMQVTYIK